LADSQQKWQDIPKTQREFQIRLMEIYAGFLEHTEEQETGPVGESDA